MKQICKQYAEYNIWANQKFIEAILQLTTEEQQMEIPSSFNTIYKTILHMWNAESIWWQRMRLFEIVVAPANVTDRPISAVCTGLAEQSKQWSGWINNAGEAGLEHVFAYRNSKKKEYKQPVYIVLMHVFNHTTYHRGQLANMLRQLGKEKIPQTDLALWHREGK